MTPGNEKQVGRIRIKKKEKKKRAIFSWDQRGGGKTLYCVTASRSNTQIKKSRKGKEKRNFDDPLPEKKRSRREFEPHNLQRTKKKERKSQEIPGGGK